MTKLDLGGVSIMVLDGGRLRLDGGAMFGIIPRVLWSRQTPPDEQHRIQLGCNCILVEWEGAAARRAIIEVGHGSKYSDKEQTIYGIDRGHWLGPTLAMAGIDPADISDVILSHLHFDHAGGLTRPRDPGALPPAGTPWTAVDLVLTFPKARVHVQRREFDDARANFGIMNATYREENYRPLDAANAWRLLDGEGMIVPGVRSILTPGHTRGHHSLVIEGRQRSAVFVGDVMPTHAHVGAAYNMAYDVLPLDNRSSKRSLLRTAADREWVLLLDHDPRMPVATVRIEKEWFALQAQA